MAFDMKPSLGLQMKLTQRLMMTPMLQQSIKLLQLSRLELTGIVHQELQENPLLEEVTTVNTDNNSTMSEIDKGQFDEENIKPEDIKLSDGEQLFKSQDDIDWQNYLDDSRQEIIPATPQDDKEYPALENMLSTSQNLYNHLMWQLRMSYGMTDEEFEIGELIIGNIDDNGYLQTNLEEIAHESGKPIELCQKILTTIQGFDPLGVGARTPQECLTLQIQEEDPGKAELLKKIINEHLKSLESKDYHAIASDLKISIDTLKELIDIILSYDPKPGRSFNPDIATTIIPDVYIYKVDNDYVISLNDEGLPQLRISNAYRQILRKGNNGSPKTRKYVEEKLRSAIWLIKSIQQRQRTLYNVTKSIVNYQRDFLDKGLAYLRPLTLVEVANEINMHESTVSRVTTNKYAHTPMGIYSLKFFFNSGFKRAQGDYISSLRVKDLLTEMIKNEDPKKPYSDSQLLDLLAKRGINIARRTIAKYREELKILPSQKRKIIYSSKL
ncbi:MAG: RNA polymerase factor sigma-54 [bacterium]